MFGVKDPIPGGLRSRVVYKFACASAKNCISLNACDLYENYN